MKFYDLDPEVAGQLGPGTQVLTGSYPPQVNRLEYVFEDWLGDDIVQSFPCFIVTERLANALRSSKMTGFSLAEVRVKKSPEFQDRFGDEPLPNFEWLTISGKPNYDDMGLRIVTGPERYSCKLIVSQTALNLLRKLRLDQAKVVED